MARCFPYPLPEGYLGNGACAGRSLLGPIKPHAETERTDCRKDSEILLKRKGIRGDESGNTQSKRIKLTKKVGGSEKGVDEEAESSGVTEELGIPACSQSPSHSSDSVKGSTKRARDECTTTTETKRTKFRIKLKVSTPNEPVSSQQASVPSSNASQQKDVHRVAGVGVSTSATKVPLASVAQPKVVHRSADVGVSTSAKKVPLSSVAQPKFVHREADARVSTSTKKVHSLTVTQPKVAHHDVGVSTSAKKVHSSSVTQPKVVHRAADVGVSTSAPKAVSRVADICVSTSASKAVSRVVDICVSTSAPKAVSRVADIGVSTSAPKDVHRVADVSVPASAPVLARKDVLLKAAVNIPGDGTKKKKKLSRSEVYDSIAIDWTAPAVEMMYQSESEDVDWLLPSKKQQPGSAHAASKDSCNSSACTTWPRAQYMPGVDLYALPYTIPF
ncbi:hypothetical protein LINGRAHAP2_LOCUS9998 [Linum grandiflorum]